MEETYSTVISVKRIPFPFRFGKRVKSNTGFRRIPSWISQARNTPSASSAPVYSQFTAPRGGNRGTSLPCNFRSFSPPSSHHPLLPPSFFHPPSSQQPAATLPSVTFHYLPLRNVEDASFHSGTRKILFAVFPIPAQVLDSWNSATILNCCDTFENSPNVLLMIRDSLLNAIQIKKLISTKAQSLHFKVSVK